MKRLTEIGIERVEEIVRKYGLSSTTLKGILSSMLNSQGAGAVFSVPEWKVEVEWHPRDRTLINNGIAEDVARRIDKLCRELMSVLVSDKPYIENLPDATRNTNLSTRDWPVIFGEPTQVFESDGVAFAFFERVHRLVIDKQNLRYIYDTRHYRIEGKQPIERDGCMVFQGPDGEVDSSDLHLVSNPESAEQIAD